MDWSRVLRRVVVGGLVCACFMVCGCDPHKPAPRKRTAERPKPRPKKKHVDPRTKRLQKTYGRINR